MMVITFQKHRSIFILVIDIFLRFNYAIAFINLIQNLAKDIDILFCLQNPLNPYIPKMTCQNGQSL